MRDCGVGANGLVGADYKPDLAVSFGDTGYDGGVKRPGFDGDSVHVTSTSSLALVTPA